MGYSTGTKFTADIIDDIANGLIADYFDSILMSLEPTFGVLSNEELNITTTNRNRRW